MSWKHYYLERAQSLGNMDTDSPKYWQLWYALEDDIKGKLALFQVADLYDFVADIPCQGSMVIMAMLPDDMPQSDM